MTSFTIAATKVQMVHLNMVYLRPSDAMRLRTRGHDYELSAVKYDFNKQNFVVRSLFHYV